MWPRVIIPRRNVTPGHNSTLNCDLGQDSTLKSDPGQYSTLDYDPRPWFNVKLWPQVWIQRWIVTPIHDSTLNSDLELGSKFNVEFLPGVIIQRGTLTRSHKSTWNFDPGSQFNVEFWPVCISSTRGIATQEGVKIQQRDQNSTAKQGHNSTKNPLTPGRYSVRGSKFYLTPAVARQLFWWPPNKLY